jgi:hypothetical protein
VARVEGVAKDLLIVSIQQPMVLNVGCLIRETSCWPSEWKLTFLNRGNGKLQSRQDVLAL